MADKRKEDEFDPKVTLDHLKKLRNTAFKKYPNSKAARTKYFFDNI